MVHFIAYSENKFYTSSGMVGSFEVGVSILALIGVALLKAIEILQEMSSSAWTSAEKLGYIEASILES